mgnify:FL=1
MIRRNACIVLENQTVGFTGPGTVSTANGFSFSVRGSDPWGSTPFFTGLSSSSIMADFATVPFKPDTWMEAACAYSAVPANRQGQHEGCGIFTELKMLESNQGLARAAATAANSAVKADASNYSDYRPRMTGHACSANVFVSCKFVDSGESAYSYYARYKLLSHPVDVQIRNDTDLNLTVYYGKCRGSTSFDYRARNSMARPQVIPPRGVFHSGYYVPVTGTSLSCEFQSRFDADAYRGAEDQVIYSYLNARVDANGKVRYMVNECYANYAAKGADCPGGTTAAADRTGCFLGAPGKAACHFWTEARTSDTGVDRVISNVYLSK